MRELSVMERECKTLFLLARILQSKSHLERAREIQQKIINHQQTELWNFIDTDMTMNYDNLDAESLSL